MRSSPGSSSSIDVTDDDDDEGLSGGASAIGNMKSGPVALTGDLLPGDV